MNLTVSKQVKILGFSFLFIFLGFNGVQQYITTFFSEAEMIEVGFRSLILIYLFFILFDPLSAVLVSKYGAKRCMILASIFYSIFILSLLSKSIILIYLASSLLGIAASFLWTGQNSYLIRASDEKSYGANAGFFSSLQSLGSALGVLILGFLIVKFLFKIPFLIFSIFPIIGLLVISKITDLKVEEKINRFNLIKKSIFSKTALRLSIFWFAPQFTYGLTIGIIPIEIKNILGISFIGILSSLFYILPILFSYFWGKLSDIAGRKKMIILSYGFVIIGLISLYFSNISIFLISGIILLALNISLMRPISYALVGDVSTKNNLEFLTALFWMVQGVGVVSALFLSQVLQTQVKTLYLISILVMVISLMILLPLLRLGIEKIKEKISQEVG
ncbi:MAG: hypothetical protein CO031_01485 [Candidatus Nealsonbacteria bacterium CG_4_9_14_0_2_um_filter_37_38]|uniref:Major facilitator superfamily (MFS) profile domain-containing protein n=1 Tax=Candidatus Nealsonbacteria bacterium CG_4_10_14_0_8_um_filter_37_14 TaxID=1974684 RepID=A0A2M7R6D9_9BACT|nr:MAG: hypothetical protein COV63_00950 [Candidatus Nealsonbacteria bacterium CG11_big_fil_rev_8_21_14_0_20_37_68]PIY89166.1 MAG: hypothetical protein COY73_01750 [Candidatus Nealsonbacteria bacterium CG_4_10_14_0_8_um_filter_37_14]PJC51703.1 MAG: hypothetical protein CO031_01485 [Candidatus Nealsonbacteria bacterium CG_4_9_14_0_2_um_filter_37_38]